MTKRTFIVCYDYGMGGLWALIDARSENEILEQYPELTIVREQPEWMNSEVLDDLRSREHHDIDGQPFGVLNVVLSDRDHA